MRHEWFLIPLLVPTMAVGPCNSQPLGDVRDKGPGCVYDGGHYAGGDQFRAIDGCNLCTCQTDGQVACTLKDCAADAGGTDVGGTDVGGTVDVGRTDVGGTVDVGGGVGSITVCGSGASTDGTPGWIVFDSDLANFNRDIYRMRADGSSLTRLTTAPSLEKEPAMSPDGTRMTFTSDRSGVLQIYLMDLASQTVTPVTNLVAGADESSFSHDGTLVAFHSGASVFVIHPDGTGQTLVATGLDTFNAYFWPRFSGDDGQLIFDRNNEIDTVALDGSGFRYIVQNTTDTIKAPSVSPDGTGVAHHSFCSPSASGALSIWTTPFSVTTFVCAGRRVTPASEPSSEHPAWGPNDVFAYERVDKVNNVAAIALISRAAGSVPCLLTPYQADNRNPTWSP